MSRDAVFTPNFFTELVQSVASPSDRFRVTDSTAGGTIGSFLQLSHDFGRDAGFSLRGVHGVIVSVFRQHRGSRRQLGRRRQG
jgi:hypothetical protein